MIIKPKTNQEAQYRKSQERKKLLALLILRMLVDGFVEVAMRSRAGRELGGDRRNQWG
jgi:hypothetical protein